jgi:predicted dehydrogenase
MKVGVIGYGYWGPNLVRNFAGLDQVEVRWCADVRADRRALVKNRFPSIRVTADPKDLFDDHDLDAIAVATPVSTHYELVKRALLSGKHVLVEKPMTRLVAEGQELLELADRRGLVLMVDHTFVYTGAVRKMKDIMDGGELGELYYFDSVRVNLGLFQSDIDVLWDLAPHDLAILTHLIRESPRFVSATGAAHTPSRLADVVYLTVHFANDFIAHVHVNWLSPVKIRQLLIGGSRQMLVYNDNEPSEKVRVYDRGVRVTTEEGMRDVLVDYRMGDAWTPKLDSREALTVECEHFVECVRFDKVPVTSATAGLGVVRLLEAADRSMKADGARIAL